MSKRSKSCRKVALFPIQLSHARPPSVLPRVYQSSPYKPEILTLRSHEYSDNDLQQLPYLNQTIEEALRLHPAAPSALPRVVPQEGATFAGTYLPGGSTICTQAYSLHRDPSIFPDPEKFNPLRWAVVTKDMKDSMMPFGGGSRSKSGYLPFFLFSQGKHALHSRFGRVCVSDTVQSVLACTLPVSRCACPLRASSVHSLTLECQPWMACVTLIWSKCCSFWVLPKARGVWSSVHRRKFLGSLMSIETDESGQARGGHNGGIPRLCVKCTGTMDSGIDHLMISEVLNGHSLYHGWLPV